MSPWAYSLVKIVPPPLRHYSVMNNVSNGEFRLRNQHVVSQYSACHPVYMYIIPFFFFFFFFFYKNLCNRQCKGHTVATG